MGSHFFPLYSMISKPINASLASGRFLSNAILSSFFTIIILRTYLEGADTEAGENLSV